VFSLNLIVFAIVLFGSQKEAPARFAAHFFGLSALHRLALLFPARLSAALAAIGRRPALAGAELVLFNACATLVLAEVALRGFYASSGQGFFAAQQEHPFTRKLVADLFGFAPNAQGYNDDAFALAKTAGVPRVAAIGDSFFVSQVPRPRGVIARTGALLRERGVPAEVYNFGIVASNVDDYRLVLGEDALAFHPDLVLVGVYVGNDLRISTAQTAFDRRSYALDRAVSDIRQRVAARRLEQTGAFRDVTRGAAGAAPDLDAPITTRERYLESVRRELAFFREDGGRAVARAWFDTLAGLEKIVALCRERGVPLAIVIQPSAPQVSRALREEGARSGGIDPAGLDVAVPQRRLAAFFAARDVPVLDLLPAFERAARERDPDGFYLRNDTHWSVSGNEIAAQELAHFLSDQLARLDVQKENR
jgi:acetyltransferase AlgX (SGNH hydrolase-like protein)